jgi:hypothetical protein
MRSAKAVNFDIICNADMRKNIQTLFYRTRLRSLLTSYEQKPEFLLFEPHMKACTPYSRVHSEPNVISLASNNSYEWTIAVFSISRLGWKEKWFGEKFFSRLDTR